MWIILVTYFSYFYLYVDFVYKVQVFKNCRTEEEQQSFREFGNSSIFSWSIWNHYEKNRQSSVVLFLLQINWFVSNIHACLLHVLSTQLICVLLMFFINMENDAISRHKHTSLYLILKTIELAQRLNSKFSKQLRSIFNRAVCHVYFGERWEDCLLWQHKRRTHCIFRSNLKSSRFIRPHSRKFIFTSNKNSIWWYSLDFLSETSLYSKCRFD